MAVPPLRPWTQFYHPQTAPDLPPLQHPHMPAIIRAAAQEFASKEAFTLGLPNGSQGGMTFAEVDRQSDEFAVYLREVAGFAPGDRISIQMPNCLAYPVVVFGTLKAGLVMVNTNPLYTAAGDGAPVRRQRLGRAGHHRSVRDQGGGGAAEDLDPHRGRRVDLRSAAAAQAAAGVGGAEVREEDDSGDPLQRTRRSVARWREGATRRSPAPIRGSTTRR